MVDADNNQDTEALDATQNIINRLSDQLDELKNKQKEVNEMVKGIFESDEKLEKSEEKAKEAVAESKSRKQEINESSEIKELRVKSADVKEDLKMVEESLNTHLLNYFQMTGGSTAVDTPDGGEREFRVTARMKPKKKS